MGITRRRLKEFGASDYLATKLTRPLQPIGKQGRAHEYDKTEVLNSIRHLLSTPKIRRTTKEMLGRLEIQVSQVIEAPSADQALLEAMQRVSEANARFEQTARNANKISDEFKSHRKKRGNSFDMSNNIVVFTS